MSNDLFYQFKKTSSADPIQHLKQVVTFLKSTVPHERDQNVRRGYEIRIKNIEDFLQLIERSSSEVEFLEKTNVGGLAMGIGTILLAISIQKEPLVSDDLRQKIVTQIYPPRDKRANSVYFRITKIPNVFEWWEKGMVRQESFGSIADDIFRGFVKAMLE